MEQSVFSENSIRLANRVVRMNHRIANARSPGLARKVHRRFFQAAVGAGRRRARWQAFLIKPTVNRFAGARHCLGFAVGTGVLLFTLTLSATMHRSGARICGEVTLRSTRYSEIFPFFTMTFCSLTHAPS
jgi:hypothetical protein